ncbi:hypothetical protein GCM10018772_19330 [Streptomyces fumanus]|uniref:Uncharacterized protein n=2 Tax=Streptomyces fumanus TaxID=67302 RepID=A0A919AA46_9ACTN|nr:hypothetical protein GCM10018772_19330 [Streptomyces fumanus]
MPRALCYRGRMSRSAELLRRIREDENLTELLAHHFEFDIRRTAYTDAPRLASGAPLEMIAGDFAGGAFYESGDGADRPVWYAGSEGEAGIIAPDLREALVLLIGLPYWRDCLKFSDDGDLDAMRTAASFLQRDLLAGDPELPSAQRRAAEALGLAVEPVPVLVERLHATVRDTGSADLFLDDTGEYDGLFGPFPPSRNPRWR